MSTFPGSPRLLKGALVSVDPVNPVANLIIFQYNPDASTRTLHAQGTGGETADRNEVLRLKGPPQETIKLEVELDAADQLEQVHPVATSIGLHPALSLLETLIYPKSAQVIANEGLLNRGVIEIIPPEAPLTLLIWGIKRVLPVRVTEFSITEEAFDTNLNPIRAKVNLGLRVLNYQDLGLLSVGGALFMAHQVMKEVMTTSSGLGSIPSASSVAASGSFSAGASLSLG